MFFYLFRYRRNIKHLTCEVRDGKEIEDEVWEYANEAARTGNDEDYNKARKWLKNLYEKLYEAKKTLEDAGKGENAGYINWRRLDIISRHRLSRKAYKMAHDIAKSLDSDEARSYQVVDIPSTKVVAKEAILNALEDKKVRKIGLYGIASGRMMAILLNAVIKAFKRRVFNEVIWVNMPQSPDLVLIQREIADRLGVSLNINNLEENAKLLNEELIRATNTDTLVIFAGVHQHFSLHEIGIPDGENCKIVITSREKRICNEMGSQKNINMQNHISKTWSKFIDSYDTKEWQEKGGIDSIVKELIEDCEALSYGPGKEIDLRMRLSVGIKELIYLNELIRQHKKITPYIVKEVKKQIEEPTAADPDRRNAK